ncbi:MAG TPA: hypothetical protein VNH84_04565, partial [Candidatus Saccharimonadales bacterium]|nr:hypothetical protein [Candidatus Saccharimonadales bacterium]
ASSAGFPYAAIWSNAVPGFHTLTARVVKSTGDSPVSPGVQIVVRPRNDAFADRLALTGWDADIFQVTRAGRREPGEPDHLFLHRQVSVWWTWTAPLDGELILSIPNFDPQGVALAVYSGGVLTNLQLVAWNTAPSGPSFYRLLPEIRLAVSAGHAYQIAAVEETGSDLALELHFRPPPPNDAFAARPEVAGTHATLEGWTILASSEPQEPAVTGASVWWKWQAPGNGILRLRAWMRPDELRGLVWTGNSLATIQPVLLLPPPPLPVSTNPAAAAVVVLASRHVPPRQPPPPAVPAWTNFVVCNVSAGTEYAISIQDTLGGLIDFSVLLDFTPAPANDDYEQRVAWVEVPGPFELENDGAGVQAGEAEHGAHSVWFNWVAPTTGVLTILETNGLSGLLAVPYEGNGLASLIPAPVAPGTGGYKVFGGRAYAVAVTAPPGMLGTWPCQLDLRPSPPNDDFANRALLTGTNVQVEFEALGASIEPGEPDPSLAGAFQSLWWTWTAPASGIANLILVGASPGYSARVFEGDSLGSLQPAGLQPTGDGGWFRAQAGRTYQLELLVWAIPSNPGPFTFSLLMPPSPSNDDFANSATLVGTNWAVNASNLGATPEPQETRDHFNSRTIWYTWQAPASGWAYLWTSSNSSPIQYFAYVGSTLAGLRTAPGFAQYGMSPTIFEAREGETYHISADGSEGRAGVLAFRLEFVPAPANDDFAGRQALGSGPASLAGTYVGATREPGEPRHTPATWYAPTIWWSWTADRSGPVVLTNFSYGLSLVVYRGTTLASLSRVAGNDRSDGFIFDASAGESYAFAADGSYGMPAVVSASLVLPGQVAVAASFPLSVRLSGVRPGPAGGAV